MKDVADVFTVLCQTLQIIKCGVEGNQSERKIEIKEKRGQAVVETFLLINYLKNKDYGDAIFNRSLLFL